MASADSDIAHERALDAAILRLGSIDPTAATKALLIEARRLKRIIANWKSLPASAEAREAMAAHIDNLCRSATEAAPSLPPPRIVVEPVESLMSGLSLAGPLQEIVCTADQEWIPSATVPGVASKLLHWDPTSGVFSAILRLEDGVEVPPKPCDACSELYVLRGSLDMGDETLDAGCYCRVEPSEEGFTASTRTGCELLLIRCTREELLG